MKITAWINKCDLFPLETFARELSESKSLVLSFRAHFIRFYPKKVKSRDPLGGADRKITITVEDSP